MLEFMQLICYNGKFSNKPLCKIFHTKFQGKILIRKERKYSQTKFLLLWHLTSKKHTKKKFIKNEWQHGKRLVRKKPWMS